MCSNRQCEPWLMLRSTSELTLDGDVRICTGVFRNLSHVRLRDVPLIGDHLALDIPHRHGRARPSTGILEVLEVGTTTGRARRPVMTTVMW
jgi:hypothetical protein